MQYTATQYDTLQHNTRHCNTIQHTATRCNTLQHNMTHCNTIQDTATRYATVWKRAQNTALSIVPFLHNTLHPFSWLFSTTHSTLYDGFSPQHTALFPQCTPHQELPGGEISTNEYPLDSFRFICTTISGQSVMLDLDHCV